MIDKLDDVTVEAYGDLAKKINEIIDFLNGNTK